MQKTAITVITVVLSFSAGAEWTYIAGTDEYSVYIDFATIKQTSNGYGAWTLHNYTPPVKDGVLSLVGLNEFDCKEEKVRSLQGTQYSGPMGRGAAFGGFNTTSEWNYVSPGSIGEQKLREACLFGPHPLPPGYKPAPAPPPGFTETLPPK